jgi:hypothetical protein
VTGNSEIIHKWNQTGKKSLDGLRNQAIASTTLTVSDSGQMTAFEEVLRASNEKSLMRVDRSYSRITGKPSLIPVREE